MVGPDLRKWAPWSPLVVPLLVLIGAAAFYSRAEWRDLAAGEPTVLMATESLVHDGDLAYERLDFDRHLVTRYGLPRELDLASGSAGRRIGFDLPFVVPLGLAPWVAWRPETGFALGQALLLALVALVAARLLEPRLGSSAPTLVALLIFASATFAHVFHATGHLWLFASTLLAASLLSSSLLSSSPSTGSAGPASEGLPSGRMLFLAGLCLALPIVSQPLNLVLVPLFLWLPWRCAAGPETDPGRGRGSLLDRIQAVAPLVFGLGLGAFVLGLVQWWWGGGFPHLAAERFGFVPATGFPLVDFPAERWAREVEQARAMVFEGAPRLEWGFDSALWGWNLLFLLVGRALGILPYFLPVVLVLVLAGWRRLLPWLVAAGLWTLGLLYYHPFTLAGGEALANPHFLPLYAASILAWEAPGEGRWVGRWMAQGRGWVVALVLVLFAAPFLGRLWMAPGAPLVCGEPDADDFFPRGYAYPTALARALLPEETSQKALPAGEFIDHMGLRLRLASSTVGEARIDLLTSTPPHRGRLWVVSESSERVILELGADAPAELRLRDGRIVERILEPGGGVRHVVEPSARRHNLWWSPRRQILLRFDYELVDGPDHPLYLRVVPDPPLSSPENSP